MKNLTLIFISILLLSCKQKENVLPVEQQVLSLSFGTGFNSHVYASVTQSDGKIITGGNFTSYDGTGANRIIRLNSDGSIDGAFVYGSGFNSDIYSLTVQSDGKIVVGGAFTSYNGTSANGIIRLNSNGSVDGTFIYGTGFNFGVNLLAIQSDGKIVVGGTFTSYNGTGANRIIRLNSNGSVDGTFVYGTGFNFATGALVIQSDGKIVVGGTFTSYNGTSANGIVRLNSNGSVDGAFVYGTGFNFATQALAIQSDGKIVVGGNFTSYNGTSANGIIRLNSTGSVDGTFVPGTGFTGSVLVITIQSDGKIVVGGNFTSYNGTSANGIIRLNSTGSVDGTLVYGTGFNNTTYTFIIQSDGKIIAGGAFTSYNGAAVNYVALVN